MAALTGDPARAPRDADPYPPTTSALLARVARTKDALGALRALEREERAAPRWLPFLALLARRRSQRRALRLREEFGPIVAMSWEEPWQSPWETSGRRPALRERVIARWTFSPLEKKEGV